MDKMTSYVRQRKADGAVFNALSQVWPRVRWSALSSLASSSAPPPLSPCDQLLGVFTVPSDFTSRQCVQVCRGLSGQDASLADVHARSLQKCQYAAFLLLTAKITGH